MASRIEGARLLLKMGARPKTYLPIEVLTWIAKRDKVAPPKGMSIEYGENGASLRMEDDSETDNEDSI